MYVVVKGDFRFGVTDVIGPFETEDEIWNDPYLGQYWEVEHREIYSVASTRSEWSRTCGVNFSFRCGKINNVFGPYGCGYDIRVQSVQDYVGITSARKVLHKEIIKADVVNNTLVTEDVYVDVPVVTEEDLLSSKGDILREVVISKQKDQWCLDNNVLFVDPRLS